MKIHTRNTGWQNVNLDPLLIKILILIPDTVFTQDMGPQVIDNSDMAVIII